MLEAANALEPIEKRYWVHPFNEKREEEEKFLQFYTLIRQYSKKCFEYYRMNVNSFDKFLELISAGITKKNTLMRNGICAEEWSTIQFCNTCPAISRQALSL
ncbi:hypothetical protein PGB90_010176 [Kerria lacca]